MQTQCKICKQIKDDNLFPQSKGKRLGLVCRACDLEKKRVLYATNEIERENSKTRARKRDKEKREEINKYRREYRKREEVKIKRQEYHKNNAERINAKTRKWYRENKERHKAKCKEYVNKHLDKIKIERAKYFQENKELFKEKTKLWRESNPHLTTHYVRKYNLAKINRTPLWADLKAIKLFYKNCPDGFQVDHIHPLQGKLISGLHVLENLQYLPANENRKKHRSFKPYWVFYEPNGPRIEVISA